MDQNIAATAQRGESNINETNMKCKIPPALRLGGLEFQIIDIRYHRSDIIDIRYHRYIFIPFGDGFIHPPLPPLGPPFRVGFLRVAPVGGPKCLSKISRYTPHFSTAILLVSDPVFGPKNVPFQRSKSPICIFHATNKKSQKSMFSMVLATRGLIFRPSGTREFIVKHREMATRGPE